jgi:hypothetical protein
MLSCATAAALQAYLTTSTYCKKLCSTNIGWCHNIATALNSVSLAWNTAEAPLAPFSQLYPGLVIDPAR